MKGYQLECPKKSKVLSKANLLQIEFAFKVI